MAPFLSLYIASSPSLSLPTTISTSPSLSSHSLSISSPSLSSPPMANQENCQRLTRAAKRRAVSDFMSEPPTKKRVVLGDITSDILGNSNLRSPFSELRNTGRTRKVSNRSVVALLPTPTPEKNLDEDVGGRDGFDLGSDDPQMCGPYVGGIYEYLRSMEKQEKRRPKGDYMQSVQKDVSANMRGILVDWLVELAEEFKVVADTLYLCISHIDRYLSKKPINRQKLQLLGVSSMLIASKYEEIDPKSVEKFVDMTENTYTKKEVVEMEADVLKTLDYEVGNPTIKTFLRKFFGIAQGDSKNLNLQLEFLGYYLAELSLIDYHCVKFLPSTIAASVTFLANLTINPRKHPWNSSLQSYTGYKPSDLKESVLRIQELQLQRRGASLVAVRNKYKQHKFKCVSTLSSVSDIPSSYFEDAEER